MHRDSTCTSQTKNRILSVVLCLVFSAAFLSSELYISKETILNEGRLDHYGKFEEQYFVHKCHLTEVTA